MFLHITAHVDDDDTEPAHFGTQSPTQAMAFLLRLPSRLTRLEIVFNTLAGREAHMIERQAEGESCHWLRADAMAWLQEHQPYGQEVC